MLDVEALESAGFQRLSHEDWLAFQASSSQRYSRSSISGPTDGAMVSAANVRNDYVLQRRDVQIISEQNTQEQLLPGFDTSVRYPEVAIIQRGPRRVSCSAEDTDLILLLADQME